MITSRVSSQAGRLFEHSVLTTDVARALRSTVAFTAAWVVCLLTGHALAAVFVATAAQNVAMLDVRGDYRARIVILLTMTAVMAVSVFAGTVTGGNVWSATLMTGALALLGGCWRHLSGDYGPNLAIVSALLFLIALSQPGDGHQGLLLMAWVCLGGVGAIVIQFSGWFVRPQHALRHAVAESWVAASDLITAMRTETNDGRPCASDFAQKESDLRATVDRTLRALEAGTSQRSPTFLKHLDDVTQLAARLATRVAAFHTSLEAVNARPGSAPIAPTLDSVLRSLANASRSVALTLITHRPEQLVALEVRLRRCADLIQVLDGRLSSLDPADADVAQARQVLAQVAELLPVVCSTLAETVDHGSAAPGFALRLRELGDLSLRSLNSWLNTAPQLDSVLVRYTSRVAVLTMIAVAAYKWFDVPRGYWIAFTALVVLQPDYGSTRQKAGQRIVGTLAGSLLGSLLLWVKMPVGLLVFLASGMAFCFAYFLKRRYTLAVFFVTLMLVLITEAVTPVHLDFTVARLISNLTGGVMALIAAVIFWPKWEQEQFPRIIAVAVRANRKYLETVAAQLVGGEPFAGKAVQAKREVERANSQASASLQRLLSEPSSQHNNLERAAALTTYNQRLTRAVTLLDLRLNKRERFTQPGFDTIIASVGGSMETLASGLEHGDAASAGARLTIETARTASSETALVYGQLTKIVTEIEAMALAAGTPTEQGA
jgi:uncharacterized membrane protein YccC